MARIRFVTDAQEHAVPADLQSLGIILEDLWDGLLEDAQCQAEGILIEEVKADLIKQGLLRVPRTGCSMHQHPRWFETFGEIDLCHSTSRAHFRMDSMRAPPFLGEEA